MIPLFKPVVGGQEWAVFVVPADDERLEEARAITIIERCTILVSADFQGDARDFYIWHELFEHAVNDVSGASYEMLGKCADDDDHEKFEERIVRARTAVAWALAKSLGFRFPKGPHE